MRRLVARSSIGAFLGCLFLFGLGRPLANLDRLTLDHVSNLTTSLLLLDYGIEVYQRPRGDLLRPFDSPEDRRLRDLWDLENDITVGYSARTGPGIALPLVFPHLVAVYPLGTHLALVPFAFLVKWGVPIEFGVAYLVTFFYTFWSCLLVLLMWSHLRDLLLTLQRSERYFAYFLLFPIFLEIYRWGLNGQCDALSGVVTWLSVQAVLRSPGVLKGYLLFSVSLFFHYRPLFFAAFFAKSGILHLKTLLSQWRTRWFWIAVTLSALCVLAMLFSLEGSTRAVYLQHDPINLSRFANWGNLPTDRALALVGLGVVLGIAMWRRQWDLISIFMMAVSLMCSTPFVRAWHFVSVTPAFGVVQTRAQFWICILLFYVSYSFLVAQSPLELRILRGWF